MATFELKMPKLGESVTEGTIGKWLKNAGDTVEKYDLLVEVQTDKVNTEIPSEVSGTLKEIKVKEGETVPVGALLAVFETAGADVAPAQLQAAPAAPARPEPSRAAPLPPAPLPQAMAAPEDIRATPAVRKLAAEHNVDLGGIPGTGLNGRVSRKDVEDAVARMAAGGGRAPAPAGSGHPARAPAARAATEARRRAPPP